MWRVGESEAARAADRFARRVDLALPAELVPVLSRRLVRRRRANLVAGCVAAACLGMWSLIELTARAVVRARPVASDVQSLAFDDAVRRLLGTTGVLPLAAGLFVAQAGLWPAAGMALVGLYVAGAVAQSALSERGSVRTHYRRRLWPVARASGSPCS